MFECVDGVLAEVRDVSAHLADLDAGDSDLTDADRVDLLRDLERLKCIVEGAQAEVAAALDSSQCAAQAAAGVRAERLGRGVAAQVALARRESPHRGQQHLSLARILRDGELPHTRHAFRAGRISEWQVSVIARETACLTREDRLTVDRAIAGDPDALESYSTRVLFGELRKLVARLDPAAVAERRRRAEAERRVTTRPAPDTMGYLTALLPVAQLVAVYAALAAAADAARAAGDPRSRGQVMADTLVARVTGLCADEGTPVVPIELGVVLSAESLLEGADDGAHLDGHGPIPVDLARRLAADAVDAGLRVWVRRLYTSPTTGELVAMDSDRRLFPSGLRRFIDLRDQFCRTLWCGAPIRHRDHVTGVENGGETSAEDGQGLCEACNYAKQAPGWAARPRPSPGHTVETTTPTGHTYRSTAPPLIGPRVQPDFDLGLIQRVVDLYWPSVA